MRCLGILLWYCCFLGVYAQQTNTRLLPVIENGRWGFIDRSGNVRIAAHYDLVGEFSGALATVVKQGKFYVIDTTGKQTMQEGYDDIQILNDRFIALKNQGGYALSDINGTIFSSFDYQQILIEGKYTIVLRKDTAHSLIFNTITQRQLDTVFTDVRSLAEANGIEVRRGKLVGMVDSLHRFLIPLREGESVRMEQGIPIFKNRNKEYLFYNQFGQIKNDSCRVKDYFVHARGFVEMWELPARKFVMTTENGRILPFKKFISCDLLNPYLLKLNGTNAVMLLNRKGDILHDLVYDRLELKSGNQIWVYYQKKIGILNQYGEIIFPVKFDHIDPWNKNGLAMAHSDGGWGLLLNSGRQVLPCQYFDIEITEEYWKAYTFSGGMDQYILADPITVEEVQHFKNVGSIQVHRRPEREPAGFTQRQSSARLSSSVYKRSSSGDYIMNFVAHTYEKGTKLKCLIPKSFENVTRLFGAYDVKNRFVIIGKDCWDIQIEEFEMQEYARVILPGDRQALLSKKGTIKNMLPAFKYGKYVAQPITYIGPFINGIARVNINGTFQLNRANPDISEKGRETFFHSVTCDGGWWGYVNGKAEMVIKADLEYASDFLNGKAIIKKNGKYGVIDSLNNTVIKAMYDNITYLENSNNQFFKLYLNKYECGIVSTDGEVLIKAGYDKIRPMFEKRLVVSKNNLQGAINPQGDLLIPCQYAELSDFSEGKAAFKEKYKWGVVDSNGIILTEPQFERIGKYHEGVAAAKAEGKWGFIDEKGQWIISPLYSNVGEFAMGVCPVFNKKRWWLIDKRGKKISATWYSEISPYNQYGLAIARKGKSYFVLNTEGKALKHVLYRHIAEFSEGLARVKNKKNKVGYIDTLGKLVIPASYVNGGAFHEGLCKVRISGKKWGYIDASNKVVIDPVYQNVGDFSESKTTVVKEKKVLVLDRKGVALFQLSETTLGKYKEGLLHVNGKYYNENGKIQLAGYASGGDFQNGIARVTFLEEGESQQALINRKGLVLTKFNELKGPYEQTAIFSINRRIGLASTGGQVFLEPLYQKMTYKGDGIFQVRYFDEVGYIRSDGTWLWMPRK